VQLEVPLFSQARSPSFTLIKDSSKNMQARSIKAAFSTSEAKLPGWEPDRCQKYIFNVTHLNLALGGGAMIIID